MSQLETISSHLMRLNYRLTLTMRYIWSDVMIERAYYLLSNVFVRILTACVKILSKLIIRVTQ